MDNKERKEDLLRRLRKIGSYTEIVDTLEQMEGVTVHIYDACRIMILHAEEIEQIFGNKNLSKFQIHERVQQKMDDVRKVYEVFRAIKEGGGFNN